MGGVLVAVCATIGVVLPSFMVILLIARCYQAFRKSKWVQGIMSGLKPAVVGLIGSAAVTVALAIFAPSGISFEIFMERPTWFWLPVTMVVLAVSLKWKKLHPIVIICIGAVLGIGAGYLGI